MSDLIQGDDGVKRSILVLPKFLPDIARNGLGSQN